MALQAVTRHSHKIRDKFVDAEQALYFTRYKSGRFHRYLEREIQGRIQGGRYFDVPQIQGADTENGAFAEPIIQGETLKEILAREEAGAPDPDGLELLESLFKKLRAFHDSQRTPIPKATYLEILEESIRKFLERFELGQKKEDVESACVRLLRTVEHSLPETLDLSPVHGDFCAENLLLGEDRLWVIDWERHREASSFYDLFVFQYKSRDRYGPKGWKALWEALAPGPFEPDRIRGCHALACLELLAFQAENRYQEEQDLDPRFLEKWLALGEGWKDFLPGQPESTDLSRELTEVFQELPRCGLRLCVLRGYKDLPEQIDGSDIDCIAHPADREALQFFFQDRGYFSKAHRFQPGEVTFYSKWLGTRWITFSVATKHLAVKFCEIPGVEELFSRSRWHGTVPILHPDDEYVHLLLHGILKKKFKETQAKKLQELSYQLEGHETLNRTLDRYALDPAETLARVRGGEWEALVAMQEQVLHRFGALAGLRSRLVAGWSRSTSPARRWLAETFHAVFRHKARPRTLKVALLGLDGSGKSTLLESLDQRYRNQGIMLPRGKQIYLGGKRSSDDFSLGQLKSWLTLNGRIGKEIVNMVELFLVKKCRVWRAKAEYPDFVFMDRTFYDTLIKNEISLGTLPRGIFRKFLYFLFGFLGTKPDLVFFLDVSPEESLRRKGEHNVPYLARRRELYLELVRRFPDHVILDASQSPEEIQKQVHDRVRDRYRRMVAS